MRDLVTIVKKDMKPQFALLSFAAKIFSVFFIASMSYAKPTFKGNFQGFYIGASAGLEKTRLLVNSQLFSGCNKSIGPTIGGGFTFKEIYYVGLDGTVVHNKAHLKKPTAKLDKKDTYIIMGRFGKIIQDNFLPYMGIGEGIMYYNYRSPSQKASLRLKTIHFNVGVDAFVIENFLIRSSLRYSVTTSIHKSDPTLSVSKKPRIFSIEIGAFYKF